MRKNEIHSAYRLFKVKWQSSFKNSVKNNKVKSFSIFVLLKICKCYSALLLAMTIQSYSLHSHSYLSISFFDELLLVVIGVDDFDVIFAAMAAAANLFGCDFGVASM